MDQVIFSMFWEPSTHGNLVFVRCRPSPRKVTIFFKLKKRKEDRRANRGGVIRKLALLNHASCQPQVRLAKELTPQPAFRKWQDQQNS